MDINKKIAENTGLVYQQLHRFRLVDDPDAESFAYEALYKAVLTYDEKSGNAFSTYAVCIISNALRMHLRSLNKKRQLTVVSYDAPITEDDENCNMLVFLTDNTSAEDYILREELQIEVEKAIQDVLNSLPDTHRAIVQMWYDSDCTAKQQSIASAMKVTQPVVSRALSAFKHKLKIRLEEYL